MKLLNPKFYNDLTLLNKTRTVEHLLPQFTDIWVGYFPNLHLGGLLSQLIPSHQVSIQKLGRLEQCE